MALMDAKEYDPRPAEKRRKIIASVVVLVVAVSVYLYITRYDSEKKVINNFFQAIEQKDFDRAYGIYEGDPDWKQHPEKYEYTLKRFTEDWTTESPAGGPIVSHHVDISKTDGQGAFGSGIIVAVRVNGDHKLFMWYERKDGTLTEPAPHILQYD